MNFINNIKYQYNLKKLQDLISASDVNGFFQELIKHSDNKKLFLQLLINIGVPTIKNSGVNFFDHKINWINSFLKEDTSYISKFIAFYLSETNQTVKINPYEEHLIEILKEYEDIKKLTFNDFLQFSYLYQFLILLKQNQFNFINNQMPFFSQQNQFNFSKNTLSQSYLYILDHPYKTYFKIKKSNDDNQELAKNIFLNLDNRSSISYIDNVEYETTQKGWHTHVQSWTDPNVLNSLNGKIILKKNLIGDTFDTLSSIVLHWIQSGLKIQLDYNLIQKYVDENPISEDNSEIEVSQKEKKFLDQYIGEYINEYNF